MTIITVLGDKIISFIARGNVKFKHEVNICWMLRNSLNFR